MRFRVSGGSGLTDWEVFANKETADEGVEIGADALSRYPS